MPQFEKQGFTVDTVDLNPATDATYKLVNNIPKTEQYDMAVVCIPNVHHLNAVLELSDVCKRILVEKPGLANITAWNNTVDRFPDHYIAMVKNNIYRPEDEIKLLREACDFERIAKIEINWLNKDRIPNPGSWFTTKEQAFGGVTHDLFPHLYCYMSLLLPFIEFELLVPEIFQMQRWNLQSIGGSSDYGEVNFDGTYDVCDYAEAHYMVPRRFDEPVPVTLRASWKEGFDDQTIRIYYKDGEVFEWMFGLCPDEVYGNMIKQVSGMDGAASVGEARFDQWVHAQLGMFL